MGVLLRRLMMVIAGTGSTQAGGYGGCSNDVLDQRQLAKRRCVLLVKGTPAITSFGAVSMEDARYCSVEAHEVEGAQRVVVLRKRN